MPNSKSRQIFLLFLGILFISAGVFLNQWTIGALFRPVARPIMGTSNLIIIWAFQFISIGAGCASIIFRKVLTEERLLLWYKNFSGAALTLIAGFVFMNVVLYSVSVIRTSLGVLNPAAQKYGISQESLYPGMKEDQIAKLMQESWSRGFIYEPFTTFKEKPINGTHVNVDENGFRHVKNQEPWPPEKSNFNVFVFGASMIFNYGVPDDETLASRLQEFLRKAAPQKNVAVYNFGRGFFYSSQERILYEQLLVKGFVPDAAVFIDGLTDFDLDFIGERPHFTKDFESFFNGQFYSKILDTLPVVTWVWSLGEKNKPATSTASSFDAGKDFWKIEEAARRYLSNKKLIEGESSVFGVKSFFIWQPVPYYKYNLRYHLFPVEASWHGASYGYPYMAEYVKSHPMGDNFLYLADMQENIKRPVYIDTVHYSSEWSGEVAARVADFLRQRLFSH